jgi:hypothetical protein
MFFLKCFMVLFSTLQKGIHPHWDNTTSDTKFDPGTAGLDVLLSETG